MLIDVHTLSLILMQWVPEITHHCPKTPFLLVGTQIDLRDDSSTIEKLAKNKQKPIILDNAEKLAKDLKAVKYVECSALTQVSSQNYLPLYNYNNNNNCLIGKWLVLTVMVLMCFIDRMSMYLWMHAFQLLRLNRSTFPKGYEHRRIQFGLICTLCYLAQSSIFSSGVSLVLHYYINIELTSAALCTMHHFFTCMPPVQYEIQMTIVKNYE